MAKVIFGSKAQAIRSIITTKYFKETGLSISPEAAKGVRIIGESKPEELWDKLGGALGDFANSITGTVIGWLNNINWTAIFGWFVGGIQFLFMFNWQTSDEELERAIAAAEVSWYGQLGETLGTAAGWFLCGVIPSLLIGTVNEAMMLHVLQDVSEEAFDEITGELNSLLQLGARQQMNKAASHLFMGLRALIKRAANGDADTLLGGAIDLVFNAFPNVREAAKTWGNKGNKPWTIAGAIQDSIESLPDGILKEFVEEFVDALGESCVEAGYVVAGGMDNFLMEQKIAKRQQLGQERVVEVLLNRNDPSSKIIVAGPEEFIKQSLITQKNNYQMLKEKDLGLLVGGEPIANTITTPGLPYMKFIFSSSKDKKTKPTYIDIYNIDRTKVDNWNTLKMACGGENGYWWGPYLVEVLLPDNNPIRCYARTEDEGIDLIEGLLQFSKAEQDYEKNIWNSKHEIKKGSRKKYDKSYRSPRQAYPWEVVIVNQMAILNEENGVATRSGIYTSNEAKIPLWRETKPDNFEKTIQELFTTPGANG